MPTATTTTARDITTRTPRPAGALLAAAGLAMLATTGPLASTAHAQSTIEWASPVDGDFGVAGNWFPAMVPGAGDIAVLGPATPGPPYQVFINTSPTLNGMAISNPQAVAALGNGRAITLGFLTGPGTLLVNRTAGSNTTSLRVADGALVEANVRLNSRPGDTFTAMISRLSTGDAPTFGPSSVISGKGQIIGDYNVQGTVQTDAGPIDFRSGTTVLGDSALVRALPGGQFGLFQNAVVSGGMWDGGDDGVLVGDGQGTMANTTVEGLWGVTNGSTINVAGVIDGPGTLLVNRTAGSNTTSLRVADGALVEANVRLNSRPGDTFTAMISRLSTGDAPTFGPSSVISGKGRIIGDYNVQGIVAPGSLDTPVNVIDFFSGDFALSPTARVEIDAAGTDPIEHDRIDDASSGSTITLDGSLDVDFVDGYIPEPRDQFEIISATTIDGSFADIDIEPVGAIGPAHIVYTGDSVIVVICAADRDADGELTIFDFLAFQNLFDSGDLRADLDEDGQLTIFDFLVYQNRFDAGCG